MLESIGRFILELDPRLKALDIVLETFSCDQSKILISGTSNEIKDAATSIFQITTKLHLTTYS